MQLVEPADKGVAVAQLRGPAPVPFGEGLFGRHLRRRRIAINQGDAASASAESQGDAEAGDPGTGHEHMLAPAHAIPLYAAQASIAQPIRKASPPNGVTKAMARMPVSAST